MTVQLIPEPGTQLAAHVAGRADPAAPQLAKQALAELVTAAPEATARNATRLTLTVNPAAAGRRPRWVPDAAAETLRSMAGLPVTAAGADVLRRATATDLLRAVRVAFDSAAAHAPADAFAGLDWGEAGPVAADEARDHYWHGGVGSLTSNPSVWVQGQPGAGKSAIVKRLCLGLVGYGYGLLVPGDVKGEYAPLVAALGGQVVRVGRGLDRLNPLDSGPLGRLLDARPPAERERLLAEVNARRAELLAALLATAHGLGRRPNAEEAAALSAGLRLVTADAAAQPVVPDVARVLRQAPAELSERLLCRTDAEYRAQVRDVLAALENLCDGPLAGLFGQHELC